MLIRDGLMLKAGRSLLLAAANRSDDAGLRPGSAGVEYFHDIQVIRANLFLLGQLGSFGPVEADLAIPASLRRTRFDVPAISAFSRRPPISAASCRRSD